MQAKDRGIAELHAEMIPAPKRALAGRGVLRGIGSVAVNVRGFALDVAAALVRSGVTVSPEGEMPDHELLVERTGGPFPGVPAMAEGEAYRCAVGARRSVVQAATAAGAWNGVATFLQACALTRSGVALREAVVEDWPDMGWRGVFLEDKWGTDLMGLADWKDVVDELARLKMNVLGVGLYGCWCVQYRGQVTEFLMVEVPGHPELQTPGSVRWYSPAEARWKEHAYLPRMFAEGFFGDLVAYGHARGVRVVPFVNSLGHNTLFPRLIPEISALDDDGKPTGYGYCLSNPRTWEFVTSFYGDIIDRYLAPSGADAFHIQMDEIYPVIGADPTDPRRTVDPDCRCAACRASPAGQRIRAYVVRLASFLASRGMKHVVVWNDQLTRHMDLVDDQFLTDLSAQALRDRLVLHWWWYDNRSIHERVHPRLGKGLRAWVGPMTSYFGWAYYRVNHPNIEKMLAMGHAEGAEGGVSYSIYDPANDFDFALMADGTWNRGSSAAKVFPKLARRLGGAASGDLERALEALDRAAESPAVRNVVYYTYTYPNAKQPYPRRYPLEALEIIEGAGPAARSTLDEMRAAADQAWDLLRSVQARVDRLTVSNLVAEAARFAALAGAFVALLDARAALGSGLPGTMAGLPASIGKAGERLLLAMSEAERRKPEYLVPAVLRDLSVLHEFLTQLQTECGEVAAGRRAPATVRWFVEPCSAQRGQ